MYPHLTPAGPIMKLNRKELATLPPETLAADRAWWTKKAAGFLGPWLKPGASVAHLTDWVERVYLNHDTEGFAGNTRFLELVEAQRTWSKLRSSLGGLYAWRAERVKDPDDKRRLAAEAEFAFQQAFALCPTSPEALYRYVNLLVSQGRTKDALALATTTEKLDSSNPQLPGLIQQLERMAKPK